MLHPDPCHSSFKELRRCATGVGHKTAIKRHNRLASNDIPALSVLRGLDSLRPPWLPPVLDRHLVIRCEDVELSGERQGEVSGMAAKSRIAVPNVAGNRYFCN